MSFGRALATVSGLTLLSRIGGFIRDSLTAVFLGAGMEADAFFVAQRLPNLFRSLFAEGAFSAAFVPLYTIEHERHGEEAAQRFAGQALMALLAFLLPFSILVMFWMPKLMLILAPGFEHDPQKFDLAVRFSTITFPYLALISVTALQTGVLNARGRFGPGAAAPIALNLVLIAGMLLAQFFGWDVALTLAWAVTVSGAVQCVWLAISCARARLAIPLLKPHFGEAVRKLFHRIGPGAVGAGAAQINLLVSTILASTLPTGAVSYLFYADRLNQLPLGIIGIAVATTLLPLLTRHIEAGEEDQARRLNSRAIVFCLALGLPATLGLSLLATPIIQTLFQHGAFTAEDTKATAQVLAAYALGVPAFLLVKVFAAGFFARHDTKTPVRIALIAIGANIAGAVLLVGPMGPVGIALASSLAVWINAAFLLRRLRQKRIQLAEATLPVLIRKLILCALWMGLLCLALDHFLWDRISAPSLIQEILALSALIGASSLAYGVALHFSGVVRGQDIWRLLVRRGFQKTLARPTPQPVAGDRPHI